MQEISLENKKIINDFLTLMKEKYNIDYLNDPECVGIVFYGSRLMGVTNDISNLDLVIIYNRGYSYLVNGLQRVDGIDVGYFEKDLKNLRASLESDYASQNSAPLSIYGNGYIVKGSVELQKFIDEVRYLYRDGVKKNSIAELSIEFATIRNRMKLLRNLASSNSSDFRIYYYFLVDKIKTFYHKKMGITRLEMSKTIRAYTNPLYRKSLCIDKEFDPLYVKMFLTLLDSEDKSIEERYIMLEDFFNYVSNEFELDGNYSFVRNKREKFHREEAICYVDAGSGNVLRKKINMPHGIIYRLNKFAKHYENDPEYVGLFVYDDNLSDDSKEIDVQVIFRNDNDSRKYSRGAFNIKGLVINFVEMCLYSIKKPSGMLLYKGNSRGFLINNCTRYAVMAKDSKNIDLLNEYGEYLFNKISIPLDESEYNFELSVINNRIKKLKEYVLVDKPNCFDIYYNVVLEKILYIYRHGKGRTCLNLEDSDDKCFYNLYNMANTSCGNREQKLRLIGYLFDYVRGNVEFNDTDSYRIIQRDKPKEKETILEKTGNN